MFIKLIKIELYFLLFHLETNRAMDIMKQRIQYIKEEIQKEINHGRKTPNGKSWSDYKIVDNEDGMGFTLVKIN